MRIRRFLAAAAVLAWFSVAICAQDHSGYLILEESTARAFPHLLGSVGSAEPVSLMDPNTGSSLWFFRINGSVVSPAEEGWVVRKVETESCSGYSVSSRTLDFVWELALTTDKRHGKITCTVTNNSSEKMKVQPLLLADTWLGEENGLPFELPDGSYPRSETAYERSDIPDWIKTSRNSSTPDLTFIFSGGIATRPQSLILGNWMRLREDIDNPVPEEGRSFDYLPFFENDSAVYISYREESISPGDSISYTLLVGLDEYPPDPEDFSRAIAPKVDTEQENLRLREYTLRLRLDEINRFLDQVDELLENGPGPGSPTMTDMEDRAAALEQLQREYENL